MRSRPLSLTFLGVLAALACAASAAQTAPIRGSVVDAVTGEALPGVSVFLAQTTRGTATDNAGRFVIAGAPVGAYVLVASMLGFEQAREPVRIAQEPVEIQIRLRERAVEVGEAQVVGDAREWRRQRDRFERIFFGPTPRGRRCRLLNPEVLDFDDTGGVFVASATVPAVFENRALGYRVTYVLDRFRATNNDRTVAFGGQPFYEDLPGTDREREQWQRERLVAYRGSFQHFLRALVAGTAEREGFDTYLLDEGQLSHRAWRTPPRVAPESVWTGTPAAPVLAFDRMLHVEYTRERRHRNSPGGSWGISPRPSRWLHRRSRFTQAATPTTRTA